MKAFDKLIENIDLCVADAVIFMMEKQTFADFYNTTFVDYIEGGEGAPTRDEVKKKLASLMKG